MKISLIKDSMSSKLLLECHISHTFLASIILRQSVIMITSDGSEFIGLKDGMSFIIYSSWKSLVEIKVGLIDS